MSDLTLFSVIDNEKYEKFVIPFIFFPLASNYNVKVEVHVKSFSDFMLRYADALELLEMYFPKRFALHPLEGEYFNVVPCGSTARFFTKPFTTSKWTKISDIDIMHVEGNLVEDFDALERLAPSAPYFALQRQGKSKLSGTMCVKTQVFYSQQWERHVASYIQDVWENNKFRDKKPPFDEAQYYYDEFVNYDLVVPVHGLPEVINNHDVRPIQGIHISPNRPAYPFPCQPDFPTWEITDERKKRTLDLMSTRMFKALSNFINSDMMNLLNQI